MSSQKLFSEDDVSRRAGMILDRIIDDTSEETVARNEAQVPVSQALNDEHIISFDSQRAKSRILFITKDASALEEGSSLMVHLRSVHTVFSEIHVAVLSDFSKKTQEPRRVDENIWLYDVGIKHWWMLPQSVEIFAKEQLQFTDGFRPDVIVSLDPFESGLAGLTLAEIYGRPFQVHIFENFLSPDFISKNKANKKRLSLAKYVLGRVGSVRVSTDMVKNALVEKFPKIADVGLLPRHYSIKAIFDAPKSNVLKSTYPQYAFIILFAGDLDHDSTLFRALDAGRATLLSPKIGMVVVGDGPTRNEFQKRAEILGIQEQVVFETKTDKLIPYLKSADLFFCTDNTRKSDELVIKAAAAGLPLVIAKTEMREDLFVDGQSAFLCDFEDTRAFTQKLTTLLNTNAFRTQFSRNAQEAVSSRLHEDPELYKISYRDSIEVVFGSTESETQN